MKKILLVTVTVGVVCAAAWQCPPVRRTAHTFTEAYRDHERSLRAALMPETVH